jgi:two-component system, NarL family, response regulator NreC
VRLLVAEDHILMRRSLTQVLRGEPGWEVVGEASDGGAAVHLALTLEPDVIVMDVAMPQVNGVDATRRILEQCPRIHIVALSVRSAKCYAAQMLRAGARGYVLKDDGPEELILAIRTVRTGRLYLSLGIDFCDS